MYVTEWEVEETAVQKLWRAVIASTVEEWVNGPLRKKREAEQFLFNDSRDYRTVCFSLESTPKICEAVWKNSRAPVSRSASKRFAQLILAVAEFAYLV